MNDFEVNLNTSDIWLTTNEACELLAIKKDTLRKACSKGKFESKKEKIEGITEYFVLLSSLPEDVQAKYFQQSHVKDENLELEVEIYNRAPKWAKDKANKYLAIFNKTDGLSGKELQEFIIQWNIENPDFKTSYCRVLDARKRYDELGIVGLLAKYGNNSGRTKIQPTWFDYFKRRSTIS